MADLFAGLETSEDIVEDKDSVGGSRAIPSDVYKMKVKYAYVTKAATEAMALNVHVDTGDALLRQAMYITSGKAKGGKNYYEKDGVKHYLPGYNQANSLCLLTGCGELIKLKSEKKVIKLYDFTAGKEVPTEVDMIMPLIGKEILGGVLHQVVDKKKKNAAGEYAATGETREENEIDKFFRVRDKLTVLEVKAKATEPAFMTAWLDKHKGVILNKATKTGATNGAPKRQVGAQAPDTELFND